MECWLIPFKLRIHIMAARKSSINYHLNEQSHRYGDFTLRLTTSGYTIFIWLVYVSVITTRNWLVTELAID